MRRREAVWIFGTTVSLFGNNALYIVFVVWIQKMTGSGSLAGLAFFAYLAPSLFSPLSGLVADRVRRARLLILTNLGQAAWVCLALLVHSRDGIWLLFVVLIGLSMVQGLATPASSALLSTVVGSQRLSRVNSIFRVSIDLARTAGPALGVVISDVAGVHTLIVVDAATFVIAAACIWQLHVNECPPTRREADAAILAGLAAGFRHILATPVLRRIIGTCGGAVLVFGMQQPTLIYVISHGLHARPDLLGTVVTVGNVGAICGGLLCLRIIDRTGPERLVRIGLAVLAVGALPETVPNIYCVFTGSFIIGAGGPIAVVGYMTTALRDTPSALQGRVMGATDTAITGPQSLGVAIGSALLVNVPYQILLIAMSVAVGLGAAWLTRSRLTVARIDGAAGISRPVATHAKSEDGPTRTHADS